MPFSQEYRLLLGNQPVNVHQFTSAETIAGLKGDRLEPQFRPAE
jgi:hypothetical protein